MGSKAGVGVAAASSLHITMKYTMGLLAVCIVLLSLGSSGCWAEKLSGGIIGRGNLAPSPSFSGRNLGYLPPVTNHCVPTTATRLVTAPAEVRVVPAATFVNTQTARKEVVRTVSITNEVTRAPVTITNTVRRTSTAINVVRFTQVPAVVTSVVTRSVVADPITPPPYQPAPVTPRPVTPAAVTSVALTSVPAVTQRVTQTVTQAPINPPAVVLPPVTPLPVVPAPVVVTSTFTSILDVKVETPEVVTRQITVTRSLPAVTSTVTTCGYNYPEPEQKFRF